MSLLLTHDDGTIRRKLLDAVGSAREAAVQDAGPGNVGDYVGPVHEDAVSVTHLFDSALPGYRGWRWSVTVATADEDAPVTVSEVVLTPGPDAIVAPRWVPWERRVRPGDLGIGDIFPTHPDDTRLAPAYATLDDPEAEEAVREIGLGRVRVMSRQGRTEAAGRWQRSEYGPRSDMARSAPASCGTCGFYLRLGGALRSAFGVCGNELSPADGHVVHAEFGCGAHSEVEVENSSPVPVAELVYDDSLLETVDTAGARDTANPGDVEDSGGDSMAAEAVATGDSPAGDSATTDTADATDTTDTAESPATENTAGSPDAVTPPETSASDDVSRAPETPAQSPKPDTTV